MMRTSPHKWFMRRAIALSLLLSIDGYLVVSSATLLSRGGSGATAAALSPAEPGHTDSKRETRTLLPGLQEDALGNLYIARIDLFLDTCPINDPAITEIRGDFQIRRNGVLVTDIPCSDPATQMQLAQYTDELIVLQGLRVMYYMDRGRMGHIPWTGGTFYDWVKSRVGGIDIRDGSGSFCCENFDGRIHFALGAQDDFNREFDRMWEGISMNIALYGHEARHVDGFFHSSCCGIPFGCDQTFDLVDMPAYGVQWWLSRAFLLGEINVGFSCLNPSRAAEIRDWFLSSLEVFRDRLCENKPPSVLSPPLPGGPCRYEEPCGVISVSPGTIPAATVGNLYNQALGASGGIVPFTFTVSAGALPGGLTLLPNGLISGFPLAAGTFNFTVTATNGNNCSGATAYSVTVASIPLLEADVAPRPTGSGTLVVSDWVQIGRFSVALDMPTAGVEFQKADCAPRATQGDGQITVADWVQAGRYSVGLDPVSASGGPVLPSLNLMSALNTSSPVARSAEVRRSVLRALDATFTTSQVGELHIELDALGNENALAFSISYAGGMVTFVDADVAKNATNGLTFAVNESRAAEGRLGVSLGLAPGRTFLPGRNSLLTLRFTPHAGDGQTTMRVNFDDSLVRREVVSAAAALLPGPTCAGATVTIASNTRRLPPIRPKR